MPNAKETKHKPKATADSTATSNNFLVGSGIEEALQLAKAQLQVLLGKTPMGVYLIDANFNIQAANPTALSVFGKIPDLIGRNFIDVIHELWSKEYADEIVQLFRHTLKTGEPYYTPERIEKRRDIGMTEDYEWWINRMPLSDGRNGIVCHFRDVSAQVSARLALAKSEEKYRTLFESIDEGVATLELIFDKAGKAVDWIYLEHNPSLMRQTGMTGNIIGKRASELFPTLDAHWLETHERVIRTGKAERQEYYIPEINTWLDAYFTRVGGEGSRQIVCVYNNITGRKSHEADLVFLAEISQDLVLMTNTDETLEKLCEKISRHFAVSATGFLEVDEVAGTVNVLQTWTNGEVKISSDVFLLADYHSQKVQKLMRSGKPEIVRDASKFPKAIANNMAALNIGAYVNMPLVRQGKWCLTLSIINSKLRDWREDELVLMGDIATRIWTRMERARAEEELEESQNQLRLALDAAKMGTFTWYPEEDRACQDAQMLTLLGLPEGDNLTLARALAETIHPDDREAYASSVARALDPNSGGKLDMDWRAIYPDGSVHWLHIYGQVSFTAEFQQRASVMHGTVLEITESKLAQNEQRNQYEMEKRLELLTEQRNALVKINKAKDDFIALASHQLRTPATAVKQYLSLILDDFAGPVPAAQAEHLQIAYDSNERQLTVINDLLKTAQLESTTYMLDNKICNVVVVAQAAVADIQTAFKMRDQTVIFDSSHKAISIVVDTSEMKLVFVNLLENASKYSYPGAQINVYLEKKAKFVLISIADTGVGISKDNQQRIFEKFTRIDNDLSDTVTGTGLGLYWVKQIVEMHKGTVKLTSELKKGSTFTIKLPL